MTPSSTLRLRLEELVEEAMIALLKTNSDISALPVTSLQDDELNNANAKIIVTAESQGEAIPRTGIHKMRARITLEVDGTQIDEPTIDRYWASIMSAIYYDTLEADLTSHIGALGVYARSALRVNATTAKSSAEDRRIRTTAVDIRCYEQ